MPDLSSWCSFGRKFQGTIPRQLPGKSISLRPFSAITLSRRQYCTAYSYTTKLPFLSLADKVYCPLESELKQAEEAVGGSGILRSRGNFGRHEPGPHVGVLCPQSAEPGS